MARAKFTATDPLSDEERAYAGYIHEGKTGTEAVKFAFGDRFKRPSQKSTNLKNDPRIQSLLSALDGVDNERYRRIAFEEDCEAEQRFRKLCRAFNRLAAAGKNLTGLVKLAAAIDTKEGRVKEKGQGSDGAILEFVRTLSHNRIAASDAEDPDRLPDVCGHLCQDPDEASGAATAQLQSRPARPGSTGKAN